MAKSTIMSRACEDEITFGYDGRKHIIPVLVDLEALDVLDNPANYTHENQDIENIAPKMKSIFQSANYIPAISEAPFNKSQHAFEANATALLVCIKALIDPRKGMGPRTPSTAAHIKKVAMSSVHVLPTDCLTHCLTHSYPPSCLSHSVLLPISHTASSLILRR